MMCDLTYLKLKFNNEKQKWNKKIEQQQNYVAPTYK